MRIIIFALYFKSTRFPYFYQNIILPMNNPFAYNSLYTGNPFADNVQKNINQQKFHDPSKPEPVHCVYVDMSHSEKKGNKKGDITS